MLYSGSDVVDNPSSLVALSPAVRMGGTGATALAGKFTKVIADRLNRCRQRFMAIVPTRDENLTC